jgi:hypothetical protein
MPGKKLPAFLMDMYAKKDAKGKGKAKAKPKAKPAKGKKLPKGGKTLFGTNKAGQRTVAQRG